MKYLALISLTTLIIKYLSRRSCLMWRLLTPPLSLNVDRVKILCNLLQVMPDQDLWTVRSS